MHTHLSPDGLSQEDLMDMLFLRLDSVSVLTVNDYGDPVSFQSGHLLPPNADSKPYRVHPMTAWDRVDIDFNAEAVSLEEELGRVLSEASEAGDSPRAILVSVSPLPRAQTGNAHRGAPGTGAQRRHRGDRVAYPAGRRHPSPAYFG